MSLNDKDRLSHWFTNALVTWTTIFLVWGLPLFHFWLKVPIVEIIVIVCVGYVAQTAMTPWLFSSRVSHQNPRGNIRRGAVAATSWLCVTFILFVYILEHGRPVIPQRAPVPLVVFGAPVVLGVVVLIAIGIISLYRRKSSVGRDL